MINPLYLDKGVFERIIQAYNSNEPKSVQLQSFLDEKTVGKMLSEIKKARFKRVNFPDRYSREEAAASAAMIKIIKDSGMLKLIAEVSGAKLKGKATLHKYVWRDFTLRNDEEKPPGMLVFFDLSDDMPQEAAGQTMVSDENGEMISIPSSFNTLNIIDCSKHYPFVKYLNNLAGKKQLVRIMVS